MKRLKILLPLLTNALLLGMVVLVILDRYNPYQGFLNSLSSRIYILILCACGLWTSLLLLRRFLREDPRE